MVQLEVVLSTKRRPMVELEVVLSTNRRLMVQLEVVYSTKRRLMVELEVMLSTKRRLGMGWFLRNWTWSERVGRTSGSPLKAFKKLFSSSTAPSLKTIVKLLHSQIYCRWYIFFGTYSLHQFQRRPHNLVTLFLFLHTSWFHLYSLRRTISELNRLSVFLLPLIVCCNQG